MLLAGGRTLGKTYPVDGLLLLLLPLLLLLLLLLLRERPMSRYARKFLAGGAQSVKTYPVAVVVAGENGRSSTRTGFWRAAQNP